MTKEFFESPKSWSRRKHRLLGKYLKPFSAKVGSWASEIFCVDGFAGVGKYNDGSPGSPLLMAHLADECAAWQRPVKLKLINVESDPENFETLNTLTEKWVNQGTVSNRLGEFGKLAPDILGKISDTPTFFFIDPFGPTDIHFSFLLPILQRNQRVTELIINFDVDGLRRLGDTMRTKAQTTSATKMVQTNVVRVTQILGSDRWQSQFASDKLSTQERERLLLKEYVRNLARFDYKVVAYPIRKSIGDSPKYYLVFCTRHPDGVMLMNTFIREEEDELLRESTTKPGQLRLSEMFDPLLQEQQHRRDELRQLIFDYVQGTKKITRGDIRRHFVFNRFGEFCDKDYNAVVQEFVNTGKLLTGHGRKRFNDDEPLTFVP